ncbi:MAG: aminotransferase class I/II-fold pyridoxal phosphate-dependent enzyme [Ruminococcaceae bacterium]|nr:aminotransferase class I/II-fold pyridoxal phosphate-dependent enzyme [Oscillospiraceae bacterium]
MDYSKILSESTVSLKPSGIRKFFDFVESRPDCIALTVGQPDFVTPWHIREAAVQSLTEGKTYYTSNAGTLKLREEISRYLVRRFDMPVYDPKTEIVVTVGGSEAIDLAFRALINSGDEVIIPEPSFVCYSPLVKMAGGTAVTVETVFEDEFKLTPEMLKKAITNKTKMLVLPYPNNPTGAILTREELEKIADVIRDTDIVILTDEIYAEMTYGLKHTSITSLPGMRERTVVVSGFSKSYAMTGWRLGYVCAPEPIAKQMLKIHQFGIMCAPTTSQFAAIEALVNGDEDIEMMIEEYNRRRRYIYKGLKDIGIDSFEPKGAFYIFPDIRKFGMSSDEFCQRLLDEYDCAIVPGNAFGDCGEGFARISYAYSVKHIASALERIEAFVHSLK